MFEGQKLPVSEEDHIGRTTRVYNDIAPAYTATWFDETCIVPSIEYFLSLIKPYGAVLDAGCGPGRDVLAISERGVEVVGVDISSSMIEQAKKKVPNGIFRITDLRHLRYPSETFAGVWACSVFNHFPLKETKRGLKEFERVLRPGGILGLIIQEGQGQSNDHLGRFIRLYTSECFRRLLVEAGFEVVKEQYSYSEKTTLGANHRKKWLIVFAKKANRSTSFMSNNLAFECRFCRPNLFKINEQIGLQGPGSILWGDDDLYVIPDIAPLIEGHLLIVTVEHYMCLGACPDSLRNRISLSQQRVRRLFHNAYKQPTLFLEHGSARYKEAGSCIDHSHLHCLPKELPIRDTVEGLLGPGQMASIDTLRHIHEAGHSYIYLEDFTEKGLVYVVEQMPCQFLRQVVTFLLDHQNWRWQTNCKKVEIQNVFNHTIEHLLPLVDSFNSTLPAQSLEAK